LLKNDAEELSFEIAFSYCLTAGPYFLLSYNTTPKLL